MSNEVQDRLRVQLDAANRSAPPEPALGDVLDQCGRDLVRHRRRFAGASVAAVAAGVVLAFTIPTLTGDALRSDNVATDPTRETSTVPEAMTHAAEQAIVPSRWVKGTVEALDTADNVLQGEATAQASRWLGIFLGGRQEEMRIIALDEEEMSYSGALTDCKTRLDLRHATSCEATETNGAVIHTIERGADADTEGWPVDRLPADRTDNLGKYTWLMQQVIYRGPNGLTVYVYEVVRASSWDEARSEWRLERSQLTDIAETVYAAAPNDIRVGVFRA